MDGMVETQLKNVISGGKYDAKTMASSVARGVTQVNYERQATRLLTSFETAKKFYKLTEDEAYFDYLEAIKKVVDTNTDLNLDGREFRMPK